MRQASRRFAFALCKNSKHSVPSITSAVELSGSIVSVALSPLGCWPRRFFKRRLFKRRMLPIYERQPSQEYQCNFYYPDHVSSVQILSRYLTERNVYYLKNLLDRNQSSHLTRQLLPHDING